MGMTAMAGFEDCRTAGLSIEGLPTAGLAIAGPAMAGCLIASSLQSPHFLQSLQSLQSCNSRIIGRG
jgi:hypothetical protein